MTAPAELNTTTEISVLESTIVGWSFCTWPTTAPTQPGSERLAWTSTSDVGGPSRRFGAWLPIRVTISSFETGVESGIAVELPR